MMSSKDKWLLIQQNRMTKSSQQSPQSPEFFVAKLKEGKATLKQLEELRILLGGQPVEWVEKFLSLDGLKLLFDTLAEKQKTLYINSSGFITTWPTSAYTYFFP